MVSYRERLEKFEIEKRIKSEEKIGIAKGKAEVNSQRNIQLAKLRQQQRQFGNIKQGIKFIQRAPQPVLSQAQQMLNSMFEGERTWGSGENIVNINGSLSPNKVGNDMNDNTAETFGFGARRKFKSGMF